MLEIHFHLDQDAADGPLVGEVWNVSHLAAISNYDFYFEGRAKRRSVLDAYPRWCEPVSGLFARCLALTDVGNPSGQLGPWGFLRLEIGIRTGGGRHYRPLTLIRVRLRDQELAIATAAEFGWSALKAPARERYVDAWDLAEHVLRLSVFGCDELPKAEALAVPVRTNGRQSYVCMRDIPEPARSVFEQRMSRSGRPLIDGSLDAVYPWDWADFLNGQR